VWHNALRCEYCTDFVKLKLQLLYLKDKDTAVCFNRAYIFLDKSNSSDAENRRSILPMLFSSSTWHFACIGSYARLCLWSQLIELNSLVYVIHEDARIDIVRVAIGFTCGSKLWCVREVEFRFNWTDCKDSSRLFTNTFLFNDKQRKFRKSARRKNSFFFTVRNKT